MGKNVSMAAKKVDAKLGSANSILSLETGSTPRDKSGKKIRDENEFDFVSEEGECKISASPPPSPSQKSFKLDADVSKATIKDEIKFLRQQLLGKSSGNSGAANDFNLKHNIQQFAQTVSDGVPLIVNLNTIAQGTTSVTRIGNAVNNVSTTLRFRLQYLPNSSGGTNFSFPAANVPCFVRVVAVEYFLPINVPATYATTVANTSSTFPATDDEIFVTGAVTAGNDVNMARIPFTQQVCRILHDEVLSVAPAQFASYVAVATSSVILCGASNHMAHIKHHSQTVYAGTAGTDIISNYIVLFFFTDSIDTTGIDGNIVQVIGTADTVYRDSGLD